MRNSQFAIMVAFGSDDKFNFLLADSNYIKPIQGATYKAVT